MIIPVIYTLFKFQTIRIDDLKIKTTKKVEELHKISFFSKQKASECDYKLTTSALGVAPSVHVPKYMTITSKIGTIHCKSCLSVSLTLCADFTRYVNETLRKYILFMYVQNYSCFSHFVEYFAFYLHVFIKRAVYVMQKPICLDHLVAMHEYVPRIGKIAAIWKTQADIKGLNGNISCALMLNELNAAQTSKYIMAQPINVIVKKIGLATLNTLTLR